MAPPVTNAVAIYSRLAADVANSRRIHEMDADEAMDLVGKIGEYDTLVELPPDVRAVFDACLASGPWRPDGEYDG